MVGGIEEDGLQNINISVVLIETKNHNKYLYI